MNKSVELDSKNDILIWLREYEGIKNVSERDVTLLLGYLEGQGYVLYANRNRLCCHSFNGEVEYIESFQDFKKLWTRSVHGI